MSPARSHSDPTPLIQSQRATCRKMIDDDRSYLAKPLLIISCVFFLTALLLLVCFSMFSLPFPMTINESRRSGLVQPTHVVAVEAPSDISVFWIVCKHHILGDINEQNSGLGSGAAVRPNSKLSPLTPVPTLNFYTH